MTLQVIESLCLRGSPVMEDRIGWGENYLFVIDGASGLSNVHVTPADSDAAWLAEGLCQSLHRLLPQEGLSLSQVLNHSAARLKADYGKHWGHPDLPDYPSAGLALFRLRAEKLEYLGLGDCGAAVEFLDGTVAALEETCIHALDQVALSQMVQMCRDTGCTMPESRKALNHVLIQTRNLRNRPEGYWIFDPSGAGISHSRQASWPANQVRSLVLISDGFGQLIDPFAIADGLPDLYRKMKDRGLADLTMTLFDLQQADPDCQNYPRFKFRDDTSALWATLTES